MPAFGKGFPSYNSDLPPRPYDPDKAKHLLDEAGWVAGADGVRVKGGERLSLNFDTTDGPALLDCGPTTCVDALGPIPAFIDFSGAAP